MDDDGALWIAKFPSEDDTYDLETREAAALHAERHSTAKVTIPASLQQTP